MSLEELQDVKRAILKRSKVIHEQVRRLGNNIGGAIRMQQLTNEVEILQQREKWVESLAKKIINQAVPKPAERVKILDD